MDQWNTIERPETSPHTYSQLIFNRGGARRYNGKKNLFSKWCLENWTVTCKPIKLEYILPSYTKINSKWLKDLKHKT